MRPVGTAKGLFEENFEKGALAHHNIPIEKPFQPVGIMIDPEHLTHKAAYAAGPNHGQVLHAIRHGTVIVGKKLLGDAVFAGHLGERFAAVQKAQQFIGDLWERLAKNSLVIGDIIPAG